MKKFPLRTFRPLEKICVGRIAALAGLLALGACGASHPPLFVAGPPTEPLSTKPPGLDIADAAMLGNMPDTALTITRNILTRDPDNVPALMKQGDILAALGSPSEASECYTRVLKTQPRNAAALLALGRIRLNAGQAAEAEVVLRRAVAAAPTDASALSNLGIALDMQDRHAEAQAQYRAALQTDPSNTATALNLGMSYALNNDNAQALSVLQPLASQPMATPRMRHDLVVALTKAGDATTAAVLLSQDMPHTQIGPSTVGYRSVTGRQ